MKLEKSRYINYLIIFLVLCLMAFICSLTAINGHFPFYIPYDGQVHLGRFEQIFESIRNGKVPSEISFIGPGHNLNALMSCYPWLSSIIFIFPRFFFHNIVISFFAGYFCINLVTGLSMYLLASEICHNKFINISASCIYVFNTYHLILLYARMAFGEAFAYAFLPLSVAGYLCILKNKNKKGIIFLTIGMSGIANSHFISLAICAFAILVVSIYLIIRRKISSKQVSWIFWSGVFSILLSLYSIYSFLNIRLFNSIIMPYKSLFNVDQRLAFGSMVKLIVTMLSASWNVGIVTMIIFAFVLVRAFRKDIPYLRPLAFFSVILYIMITLPVNNLKGKEVFIKYFGFIQFQGRLLSFFVLCVILAFILCLKNMHNNTKIICLSTNALLIVFSIIGVINLETNQQPSSYNDRSGIDFTLDNSSFYKRIYNPPLTSFEDYLPGRGTQSNDPKIGKVYKLGDGNVNLQWEKSKYNSETFKLIAKQTKKSKLSLAFYKSVNYSIFINNKKVRNLSNSKFLLKVKRGSSLLRISSNPKLLTIVIFYITIIMNAFVYFYALILCLKLLKLDKSTQINVL